MQVHYLPVVSNSTVSTCSLGNSSVNNLFISTSIYLYPLTTSTYKYIPFSPRAQTATAVGGVDNKVPPSTYLNIVVTFYTIVNTTW